MNHQREEK